MSNLTNTKLKWIYQVQWNWLMRLSCVTLWMTPTQGPKRLVKNSIKVTILFRKSLETYSSFNKHMRIEWADSRMKSCVREESLPVEIWHSRIWKLYQDISRHDTEYGSKLNSQAEWIESLTFDQGIAKDFIKTQKQQFQWMNA